MVEFKREERYIVVKLKDLKYASAENKLLRILEEAGIPTRECVVVESDWPEYEPVWEMIQARIEGKPNQTEQLRAELAKEREKAAKWGRVFGHLGTADECGNEWIAVQDQLSAAQATIALMREKLTSCRSSIRYDLNNYERALDDMDRSDQQREPAYDAVSKERRRLFRLVEYIEAMEAIPANLDALHEAIAAECERLAEKYDFGFGIGSYLREEAAAHRAKKTTL